MANRFLIDSREYPPAKAWGVLALVLLIGLSLRVWGLSWGLPVPEFPQTQTYYPDEQLVFITLKSMRPAEGNFRPSAEGGLLGLGPFYAYLTGAAAWAASRLGILRLGDTAFYHAHPAELNKLYLTGRWVNVALALATAFFLFLGANRLYGPAAGLLAAAIYSWSPAPVFFSQAMSRDISQVCFLVLAYLLAVFSFTHNDAGKKSLLPSAFVSLSGFCFGLSLASKYSSFLFFPSFLIAIYLFQKNRLLKSLACFLGGCGLGFFLGNPYAFLAFGDFGVEFIQTWRIVNGFQSSDAFQKGGGWLFYGVTAWRYGVGIPLALLLLGGILWAAYRRSGWDWVWASAILPYLIVNAGSNARFVRYTLPLLAIMSLWAARAVVETGPSSGGWRTGLKAAVLLVFLATLAVTGDQVNSLRGEDARLAASRWSATHMPAGSRVATAGTPYFHHPNLVGTCYWRPDSANPFQVSVLNYSVDRLKEMNPDYVVLTDYDYFPLEKGLPDHPWRPFLQAVMRSGDYEQVAVFDKKPGGFRSGDFFPHDWRYPFPEIRIYQRAGGKTT